MVPRSNININNTLLTSSAARCPGAILALTRKLNPKPITAGEDTAKQALRPREAMSRAAEAERSAGRLIGLIMFEAYER